MSFLFTELCTGFKESIMFCRLCAQKQPHSIPIFSETSLNIDRILYNLFSIEISSDDILPTVICLDCFRKTNSFNEFKASIQQAQEILRLLIIPQQPKLNVRNIVEEEAVEHVVIEESNVINVTPIAKLELNEPELEAKGSLCNMVDNTIGNETAAEIDDEEIEMEVLMDDDEDQDLLKTETNAKLTRQRRDEFKNLLCTECDETFSGAMRLTRHFKIKHKKPVQFKCSFCSKIYKKYRSFTRHVVGHVESKQFICDVCNRSFSHKFSLKNHLYSHMPDRTFECHDCHLKFKQLSSLFNHQKVHTHVYSCDECNKLFSTSLTLLQHKKAKHFNQKDKICDICNKGYASLSGLYYHKLSHVQRLHVCTICCRKFNTNALLKRHMIVHKDAGAEHTCEFCGKSFKSKNSLILHKKMHSDNCDAVHNSDLL